MSLTRRRLLAAALAAPLASGWTFAQDTALANGVFIVAKSELRDPNFRETVVLITQPEPGGGPLGVIVNRPLGARLSEALPGLGVIPESADALYGGGPVMRNRVLFLVRGRAAPAHSLPVLDDVYLSGDPELPAKVARGELTVETFRGYVGYAGWAPRQLQAEIAAGGWYLAPADADTIFNADAAAVWPQMIKRLTTHAT